MDERYQQLMQALAAAANEDGPAVEVYIDEASGHGWAMDLVPASSLPESEEPMVVVRTSGSTGRAKRTVLSVSAMASSAQATAEYLGFEGQWLLAMPVHYVAGLSVLTRSLFAGTQPVIMDQSGSFTAQAFTEAAESLLEKHRLTALVPTQLARLLDSPSAATLAVLKRFDAILLGGARASADLLASARHHGLKIFQTYGSAETCGGVVYNGTALPGVTLAERDGRILIAGPTLADGYAGNSEATAQHFVQHDGRRWYLTDDLGSVDGSKLKIIGRVDDVINTGGVKLSAGRIEAVLDEYFSQCLVLGVPDPEWGQAVALAYSGPTKTDEAFTAVAQTLGREAVPKRVLHYPGGLPLLPNGKYNRRQLGADLAAASGSD